jgi:CheY-specific phosphatase CheX
MQMRLRVVEAQEASVLSNQRAETAARAATQLRKKGRVALVPAPRVMTGRSKRKKEATAETVAMDADRAAAARAERAVNRE